MASFLNYAKILFKNPKGFHMITSNINEILIKEQIKLESNKEKSTNPFIDSLIDTKNSIEQTSSRTNQLTYENIKGITLEEIESLFTNEDDKQMAKNLRLATMFTDDKYLGQALFNTVLGQDFQIGYSYLFDSYNDKHSYFSSLNSDNSLGDILNNYISTKIEDPTSTQQIPQEYLDEILLEVNSFNFITALSNTSKDQYGRYKDEDDDYAFLYNNYQLKYQELLYKYEDLKSYDEKLLQQY